MPEVRPDSTVTRELLERAGADDAAALNGLLARHRAYLLRVVETRLDRNLRSRLDPSDVVQETQLEAARRLPDYLARRPMPFRLWLLKTALKRLGMLQREHAGAARRSVRREVALPDGSSLQLGQQLLAAGPTPSEQLSRRELARQVREAIGKLSDADREILILRNFEGLSNQEAASVLDIDPATASKRHGRALLRLHNMLLKGGFTESQL